MTLSDLDIRNAILNRELVVDCESELDIRPASICLHLCPTIYMLAKREECVDVLDQSTYPELIAPPTHQEHAFILGPGDFALGATVEKIGLSTSLSGHISNISGLARLGLNTILSTHISPGFGEQNPRPITLEIHNISRSPIKLTFGMRICHLIISRTATTASIGYDSKGRYILNSPDGSEYFKSPGLIKI